MRKKQFKAESKRLLDLMINSIYTHQEIFLREIISNASDAIDKLAYTALTDEKVGISREDFERYMMATGEMATDVGTILYGKEAVASGLIDRLGGLNDALTALHRMIGKQKK